MRRQATLGALLLITVGVILGATVFRSDIARATGLKQSQSVIVDNTAAQAVPVREQNLDGGNIKVHEQGTATVRQAGSRIRVNLNSLHQSYVVPAGKRLVIEYVSGLIENDDPSAEFIELGILDTNGATATNATFAADPIHDSPEGYVLQRDVRIYMSAGETVALNPARAFVTLYGTLDDA